MLKIGFRASAALTMAAKMAAAGHNDFRLESV
jgi:hypothetical protein